MPSSENCQLYSEMGGTSLAVLGGIALLCMRLHVGSAPRQATPDTPGDVEPRFSRGESNSGETWIGRE